MNLLNKRNIRLDTDKLMALFLKLGIMLFLSVFIILPLSEILIKSLSDQNGLYSGLQNYISFFSQPGLRSSLLNSLSVSAITTVISVCLAFFFAYSITMTKIPFKNLFLSIALLPLFAPTMMHALSLIYIFGNKGLITTGFFGIINPDIFLHFKIYGMLGIVFSEIIYTFPQALLILLIALSSSDSRLYDASKSLGANHLKTFFNVTLPNAKYGIFSAIIVCFTLTFTDFGAPKVVGGQYHVLAVDIYKQVIGQQNFAMGSTISIVLLFPTLVAFYLDRMVRKKANASITSKAVPLTIQKNIYRDFFYGIYVLMVTLSILFIIGVVVYASLIKIWPYNLSLTLKHYFFEDMGNNGLKCYFNSIYISLLTAIIGTILAYLSAWLIDSYKRNGVLNNIIHFLALLPMALPGLVIGLSYIFFFNKLEFTVFDISIKNPFSILYKSFFIMVFSNIIHFFSVSYLTCSNALKKIDNEFYLVSDSLGVSRFRNLSKVILPVTMPAILETAMYLFVNSMVTISAAVFLFSSATKPASIAIVDLDDAGDVNAAAAMAVLLLVTNIIVRLVYLLIKKNIVKYNLNKTQRVNYVN